MKRKITFLIIIIAILIGASIFGIFIILNLNQDSSYFYVTTYDPNSAYNGTTIFTDLSDDDSPRIVEVDMEGNIIWEYQVPEPMKYYTNPGFDVELLPNNNILYVAPQYGIFEINRAGAVVWSHLDDKCSHDADRLPGGNTIFIWGGNDTIEDLQVKEVNQTGDIEWFWKAKDHFYPGPYENISMQGWTHANAVSRLPNGNTLINLRNFNLTILVNQAGSVLWSKDWTPLGDDPHEPELLPNGNLLIALQWIPEDQIVEINMTTGDVVWSYGRQGMLFARDADRLPNNNTLIQAVVNNIPRIFEVTMGGDIVWELIVRGMTLDHLSPGWFYKAQRK